MPGVKITKFMGIAPKVSPEHLPEGAGQTAHDLKLYSGDLLPYNDPSLYANSQRSGTVQKLHALRNPNTNALVWLAWTTDVDVMVASDSSDNDQRFYYTGDGVPKVSTYTLATTGAAPYPTTFYELGLPLPETTPVTSAASFSTKTTASYARDAGNTATIVTGTAHGLITGNIVTIAGFVGAVPATFNTVNVRATVIDTTTFTYYNQGDVVATTASTAGSVYLAGNTITRQYVYTWFTPWEEESIASEPSDTLFIKEGQVVTVNSLPTARPSGDNFIRGIRLYRTLTSSRGTEFYRLSTCWYPQSLATVARASNVATVTTVDPHNMIVDERFKISGCSVASFDITGGIVTEVVDETTFKFAQTAANVSTTAATGTLYHNVSEQIDGTPRYWGDGGNFAFTDDFAYTGLTEILLTDEYDAPDASMIGITSIQNHMHAGFFGNQLCLAEPTKPHAWPIAYRRTFPDDIVAIATVGGVLVVLTENSAYRVAGSHPSTLSIARIDKPYPCLSKRSVVNMGYGILFATHGGLALWSASTGLTLATTAVHHWDTWDTAVTPSTIMGIFHEDRYVGSHSTGSFTFERNEQTGGTFVTLSASLTAGWVDPLTGILYYALGTAGAIYRWDDPGQPLSPGEWKSKVHVLKNYINLGAARVVADFTATTAELDAQTLHNITVPTNNAATWALSQQLGTLNGPTDYMNGAVAVNNQGGLNSWPLNGDGLTENLVTIEGANSVIFQLWADKELVFSTVVLSDAIFRMPTGYKSDTFEVGVSGSARIRAIHLGESPASLSAA